ncbi:MAG: hypothetical protein HC923_10010 [Myxococcales bacterium]|nr:hypothetical protein [Myxococcales bacterium]
MIDSQLRGGYVGERLEIDATNSTMNVCVPGILVVRARENSRIEYRCSPETLEVEVDDTGEVVPVD